MKTNSGRVLEMPKTEEGPTTQQEMEQLSANYQATVRLRLHISSLDMFNKQWPHRIQDHPPLSSRTRISSPPPTRPRSASGSTSFTVSVDN